MLPIARQSAGSSWTSSSLKSVIALVRRRTRRPRRAGRRARRAAASCRRAAPPRRVAWRAQAHPVAAGPPRGSGQRHSLRHRVYGQQRRRCGGNMSPTVRPNDISRRCPIANGRSARRRSPPPPSSATATSSASGPGRTVAHLLPALAARRLADPLRSRPRPPPSGAGARRWGSTVEPFEGIARLDIAIDGADQVDPARLAREGRAAARTRARRWSRRRRSGSS